MTESSWQQRLVVVEFGPFQERQGVCVKVIASWKSGQGEGDDKLGVQARPGMPCSSFQSSEILPLWTHLTFLSPPCRLLSFWKQGLFSISLPSKAGHATCGDTSTVILRPDILVNLLEVSSVKMAALF